MENPLQSARLPDASRIELQYPTRRYTPAQDRRYTWRILFYGALAGLVLSLLEYILFFSGHNQVFPSGLAAAAVWIFAITVLERRKPWWRWLIYVLICPTFTIAFYTSYEPYFRLAVAMLFSMYVADCFATHYFCLQTTVPMSLERANRLRNLWDNRLRLFGPRAQGVEFYRFSFFAIPFAYLFLLFFSRTPPRGLFLENFPLLTAGFLLLLLFPLFVEALAAFLFDRQYVSPRVMFRAFRRAVVEWFTYNRHGAKGPATFQSPIGNHHQRIAMSLAAIFLFASWIVPLFSANRDAAIRVLSEKQTPKSQLSQTAPTDSPPAEKPKDESTGPMLEPFQKAMLERMPLDKRSEYLDKIKSDYEAQTKQPQESKPKSLLDRQTDSSARMATALFFLFLFSLFNCIYPAICMVLPPLFFLACCFTTAARVVGFYGQQLGTADPEQVLSTQTWDDLVKHAQAITDKEQNDYLLLGTNAFDDTPVIVPREVFAEHAHLLGDSGSGKTSLGLASLIAQFIRFADSSVVILDLKGDDLALFEGARIEADRAGLPFRWFTNELGRSSYIFNPLTQRHFSSLSLYQRADVLSAAMGLQYGKDYGKSYYSDANSEVLYKAINKYPGTSSFSELAEILRNKKDLQVERKILQDASHLGTAINRLAACESLNATAANSDHNGAMSNAIDFSDVFATPQVLYFYLPAAIGSASSGDIARLALYALLSASKFTGPDRRQVYLFIDEFQRIVAHNLEMILQTARSMNIGVILANQTLSDLKTQGANLIPTVCANTRFKQIFAASDLVEQQHIVQSSGETLVYSRSWSEYLGFGGAVGSANSVSTTEMITPRLRPNDILLASDHPLQSIVYVTRGKGYAQYGGLPFIMTSAYHIDYDEYDKRRRAAWPDRPEETILLKLKLPERQETFPFSSLPSSQSPHFQTL